MTPALILFGIQSIIRITKVGKNALEQHYRDQDALFPELYGTDFNREEFVNTFFFVHHKDYIIGESAIYKDIWGNRTDNPAAIDVLYMAAIDIKRKEGVDLKALISDVDESKAGLALVKQWRKGEGPLSPFARVIMSAADIALEYIGSNPTVLKVGGAEQKVLGAFATSLSKQLPDDGKFGNKQDFAERVLSAFLRAGLSSINQNPQLIVSEVHLQALMSATLAPFEAAFKDDDINKALDYKNVSEILMGPAATAAIEVIAKRPEAFFGNDFKTETVIGSLTKALFDEVIKDQGVAKQFTKEGFLDLYKAVLNVAVEQPEIFIGHGGEPLDRLAGDLLSKCAEKLKAAQPPFSGRVGTQLASAVMQAVSENAHNFTGDGKNWGLTVADIVEEVTKDLGDALDKNQKLKMAFSSEQLIDLGRIVLARISSTPAMIVGPQDAVGEILRAVTNAMIADEKLLLSGDDWKEIIAVAADEAAKNPGRLFKLQGTDAKQSLARDLIEGVLNVATDILRKPADQVYTLDKFSVLFGKTLKDTIVTLIQNTSGNVKQANDNKNKVFAMIKEVNTFVATNSEEFGSKEFLRVFRKLLGVVLNGEDAPKLDVKTVRNLLAEGGK